MFDPLEKGALNTDPTMGTGAAVQTADLYVASCAKDGGIYQYRLSEQNTVESVGFTPMDRPMYMAVENGKMYVLLRTPFENAESGLITYDMDAEGRLRGHTGILSTKGTVACHLTVDGEDVYAANYSSGSVIKMPDLLVVHHGQGPHPDRQTLPHTHFVSTTPDGEYICVTDLGVDTVFIYHKDMTPASEVKLPAGHGPRHLAFHGDKTHVFCANELESTVSLLRYQNGKMALIDTVSALPEDFKGESAAAAIRCVGDTVYVSNRGHDSIAVLDFSDGRLTLRNTIPTYGHYPLDFWIHKDLIIVTNELSDEVTLISLTTGREVGKIAVKAPLCVMAKTR